MNSDHAANDSVRIAEYFDANSGIATAYAGWLLAQLGADVTQLSSARPANAKASAPEQSAREVLAHGKKTTTCPAT